MCWIAWRSKPSETFAENIWQTHVWLGTWKRANSLFLTVVPISFGFKLSNRIKRRLLLKSLFSAMMSGFLSFSGENFCFGGWNFRNWSNRPKSRFQIVQLFFALWRFFIDQKTSFGRLMFFCSGISNCYFFTKNFCLWEQFMSVQWSGWLLHNFNMGSRPTNPISSSNSTWQYSLF